jgi:superfamily II DNA or RNA helicase
MPISRKNLKIEALLHDQDSYDVLKKVGESNFENWSIEKLEGIYFGNDYGMSCDYATETLLPLATANFDELDIRKPFLTRGGNEDNEVTKLSRRYMSNFNKRRKLVANAKQKMECMKNLVPSFEAAERLIIFAQTKEAAEKAVEILVEENFNAKVLDATMSIKDRKAVFSDFENGEEDIVSAPMLLDEGIDVPAADLAIILASSKSSRQMIQRMGRVLRKNGDGRLARVAIIYVKGTMEDPEQGAHEVFIDAIRPVDKEEKNFIAKDYEEICDFLNDWN